MSDNDKMREAIIQFGQDNPSLDLDFRLHTHGKYLTQEKAIVASRAFKAGAAWQAAQSEQSVPVAADPGYWQATDGGPNPNYQPDDEQSVPVVGDVLFYASDSTPTAESQIQYDVCAYQKDYSFFPVYRKPTHSITAAELEQLRKCEKDAERKEELVRTMRHLRKTLEKIDKYRLCMSYNDSYFGEPEGAVKRVCSELQHCIDAAIAAEGEKE